MNTDTDLDALENHLMNEQIMQNEGITHINMYCKANTELGRYLSHKYIEKFVHPELGYFTSIEAFWVYIKSVDKPEELRRMQGSKLHYYSKTLKSQTVPGFKNLVLMSHYYRLKNNPRMLELFTNSTLPFDMYYIAPKDKKLCRPTYHRWLTKGMDMLRECLKNQTEPDFSNF